MRGRRRERRRRLPEVLPPVVDGVGELVAGGGSRPRSWFAVADEDVEGFGEAAV